MWYNQRMVQSSVGKQSRPIIAAVLVFVILGALVLLSAEFFYDIETGGSKPYSTSIFSPVDHTVDWLAENAISVNRTKKVSYSTFRNGIPRVLMLLKTHSTTENLTLFPVHTVNPDYFADIRNDTPLKLRI